MLPLDLSGIEPTVLLLGAALFFSATVIVVVWAARERAQHRRDVEALLRKIEILTAPSREFVIGRYDGMVSDLVVRVPQMIQQETGARIFETESLILTRLAELEPSLKSDRTSREKMDRLIESMESLESTVSSIAAETTLAALQDARERILAALSQG